MARFYVAFNWSAPYAILRRKDAAGLAEWRARKWERFPGEPLIVDVTHSIGAVLRDFLDRPKVNALWTYLAVRQGRNQFAFTVTNDAPPRLVWWGGAHGPVKDESGTEFCCVVQIRSLEDDLIQAMLTHAGIGSYFKRADGERVSSSSPRKPA